MTSDADDSGPNFKMVARIIELLSPLDQADREHVYRTIGTWFRMDMKMANSRADLYPVASTALGRDDSRGEEDKFSDRPLISVQDFILEKDPLTEVERLACLAYYLKHYQDMPHFKTLDLSKLNTEAAQRKLSNPALTASNATRDGFFVQAPKSGYRQLSAMGERFVQLLPNREAAQQIKKRMSPRRGKRGGSRGATKDANGGEP
ncbi:MAG: hypothetical protein WAO00_06110 [Chthoniobacterales bacterium]